MATATTNGNGHGNQQIAVQTTPQGQLKAMLEKNKNQIAMALPKHLTPDRMIRVALTAFSRTPQLQECTTISILGCVIQASELGLELTGPLGQAYMVPRWNKNIGAKEATFQVGYRGLMDLAYRSGRVSSFAAHCVHERDVFDFQLGTRPFLRHKPTMDGDRGNVIAVYAVLTMKDGAADFEVMSTADVNAHRDRYADKKAGDFSPWKTAWEEMAKKTVIRRLAKRAPMCVDMQKAAVVDEASEAGASPLTLEANFTAISQTDRAKELLTKRDDADVETDQDPLPHTATSQDDQVSMMRQDAIDQLLDNINAAATMADLEIQGGQMKEQKEWLGDDYGRCQAAYTAKYKVLTSKK